MDEDDGQITYPPLNGEGEHPYPPAEQDPIFPPPYAEDLSRVAYHQRSIPVAGVVTFVDPFWTYNPYSPLWDQYPNPWSPPPRPYSNPSVPYNPYHCHPDLQNGAYSGEYQHPPIPHDFVGSTPMDYGGDPSSLPSDYPFSPLPNGIHKESEDQSQASGSGSEGIEQGAEPEGLNINLEEPFQLPEFAETIGFTWDEHNDPESWVDLVNDGVDFFDPDMEDEADQDLAPPTPSSFSDPAEKSSPKKSSPTASPEPGPQEDTDARN